MSLDYTYPGLEATREAMYHFKMKPANDEVGHSALRVMAGWGAEGIRDLWEVAMLTYWPVVQHLFGKETFSPERTPDAIETLWAYDEDFKQVANGMPRSMFPDMEKRAQELSGIFATAIEQGAHLHEGCPLIQARLGVMEAPFAIFPRSMKPRSAHALSWVVLLAWQDPEHTKVSVEKKARFMFSVFWASQGNTIPGHTSTMADDLAAVC